MGLIIDNKLNAKGHVTAIQKRTQRLHVIRKLKALSVAPPPPAPTLQKHHPTHPAVLLTLFLHNANRHLQKPTH